MSLTLGNNLAAPSEARPRALKRLRQRGSIWSACLVLCLVYWIALGFGIYALIS